jgi:hypothetical protein
MANHGRLRQHRLDRYSPFVLGSLMIGHHFVGIGFHQRPKHLGRLSLTWKNLSPEIGKLRLHRRIGQCLCGRDSCFGFTVGTGNRVQI